MTAQATSTTAAPVTTAPAVVAVEVAKAENEAVDAAMGKVTSLIENIAKAAGVEPATPAPATEATTKAADALAEPVAFLKKSLEDAGMSSDDVTKAVAEYQKRFGKAADAKDGKDGDKPPFAKTTKALEDTVQAQEDTILATLETIQKAKSMTPARVAKLKEAIESLQKLMMDVIAPNASPPVSTPTVMQHPNPNTTQQALSQGGNVDVSKTVAELGEAVATLKAAVAERDEGLGKKLEDVTKRLDGIDGAKPAAQSGGNGVTETTEVKKGFWDGTI